LHDFKIIIAQRGFFFAKVRDVVVLPITNIYELILSPFFAYIGLKSASLGQFDHQFSRGADRKNVNYQRCSQKKESNRGKQQ
jgi:hypothetical protein